MEEETEGSANASVSATKASSSSAQSVLNDLDEMESMLSLTQTISFDEDDDQNKSYTVYNNKDDDATYTTDDDDDSYSSNSLKSVSTRRSSRRGRKYKQRALVACGEGIEDASDKFFESIVDTGRVISSIMKRGPTLRKFSNTFFMTEEERVAAKKEAVKRLEEERRVKREAQMKEELKQAHDEVGMSMANLWREDKRFAC